MPDFEASSDSSRQGLSDSATSAELEKVLETVPTGALALAGTALGLLLLAWLFVYVFIFLARGPIS